MKKPKKSKASEPRPIEVKITDLHYSSGDTFELRDLAELIGKQEGFDRLFFKLYMESDYDGNYPRIALFGRRLETPLEVEVRIEIDEKNAANVREYELAALKRLKDKYER